MAKLTDAETERLVKKWKIPHVRQALAKTPAQAGKAGERLGWPVVMKVSSPDIIHKTEVGGIVLNVGSKMEAESAFERILGNARKKAGKARINGVLVQEMVRGKEVREVIIGSKQDPTFGPVIMFGLGGVFVEVMKDVSFRVVPLERSDAREMIEEIRSYPILAGSRGQKPVNFKALEDCILAVSRMVWGEKRIKELDINPLFADSRRVLAGDVRVLV